MKKLPYIGIIVLLLVILFQNRSCKQPNGPNTPKIDTVIVYKHIVDTIVVEKPVLVSSKPDTVWMEKEENAPDTTYEGLLFQYKLLGGKYFTTNVFKSDFKIADYGYISVTDSIYGNWLMNSTIFTDLKIPTTTITIEKEAPKKAQLYFGPQISMSKTYPVSGVYGSLLLKTKQDKIMGVPSSQIGQSAEYYVLQDILKQLQRLTQIIGSSITTTTTTTV